MTKASETQVGGYHYRIMGDFQPWDVLKHWLTTEEYRGYQKGVAIAYLARERSKGGSQDIAKAAHHLQKLIEVLGEPVEPLPIIDQPTDGAACCGQPNTCETPCFHGGDGWIAWAGGECPVPLTTRVEFRTEIGQKNIVLAGAVDWGRRWDGHDITAYRIITTKTN